MIDGEKQIKISTESLEDILQTVYDKCEKDNEKIDDFLSKIIPKDSSQKITPLTVSNVSTLIKAKQENNTSMLKIGDIVKDMLKQDLRKMKVDNSEDDISDAERDSVLHG